MRACGSDDSSSSNDDDYDDERGGAFGPSSLNVSGSSSADSDSNDGGINNIAFNQAGGESERCARELQPVKAPRGLHSLKHARARSPVLRLFAYEQAAGAGLSIVSDNAHVD